MSRSVPRTPPEQGVDADVPHDRTSVDDAVAALDATASPDPNHALAEHPTGAGASGVRRPKDRLRVAVPVALSLSLVMLSLASVLAIRTSSAADEATSQQELPARQPPARRPPPSPARSTSCASRPCSPPAPTPSRPWRPRRATPRRPSSSRPVSRSRPWPSCAGLVSIARLRGATGREIVRVVDEQTGRTGVSETANLSSGASGSPWVAQALELGAGAALTTDEHASSALLADVVSTAVTVGSGDRAVGVLEVDTPVAWLQQAAQAVAGGPRSA